MKPMKITKIEIYKIGLEFVTPFKIALGVVARGDGIAVIIRTDAGLYGIGEACPYWFITGETQAICVESGKLIARFLLGKNPLEIERHISDINAVLKFNSTIKSAFDMALFDIASKYAGMPLYAFLGGKQAQIFTDFTIGIGEPKTMAEKALSYLDRDANSLKVKLGTTCEEDVARIRAIRDAVGPDLPIRIDANQGWNTTTALSTLHALAQFNIEFCEQPVPYWDINALKRVHEKSPIPIMADESLFDQHDAFRLANLNACTYFNIKLAKSGGISAACKINAIGEAAGIPCMVGGMFETRVGISAGAHLILARENIRFADLDTINHFSEDPVIGGAVFTGSRVDVPDTPGHGAEYDPSFLEKMEKFIVE